ncbi:PREDICTED: uncharacterized protein LOC106146425 [Chinchilla lanigera]|uniref:uncharacterized protein LOC106146425 n=1 Tax=Chinchilla lanigera TaxID=34839 RepID=UPI0006966B87|nr:PREDICTED: uncharacterized protein LOC106146425 [Chinchilla lanigera]
MHRNILLRNAVLARELANSLQTSGEHNHRQWESGDTSAGWKFWKQILIPNQESRFSDYRMRVLRSSKRRNPCAQAKVKGWQRQLWPEHARRCPVPPCHPRAGDFASKKAITRCGLSTLDLQSCEPKYIHSGGPHAEEGHCLLPSMLSSVRPSAVTIHEQAGSADRPHVLCKQWLGERSVHSGPVRAQPRQGEGHYSLEPAPPCLPIFTRGFGGVGAEGGRAQESGAVCFPLCVNNTTSVPQPGSWSKVK